VNAVSWSGDGCHFLSASGDNTVKLWFLDWELANNQPADWDEGARPYLEAFLTAHRPFTATLPQDRGPTKDEITRALTRKGQPAWTEEDFQHLLYTLGGAGYGWLSPDGIRRQLEQMATRRSGLCGWLVTLFRKQ
jgi:hypothetical protein